MDPSTWAHILLFFYFLCFILAGEDYYAILGLAKDADNRAIRKAFKKLALQMHPDKHPDDKKAHDEFIKINRIYEVLSNEELRKKYDLFGEEGLSDEFQSGGQYHSWQFYNENFGIYDDDIEVLTLSRTDFSELVSGSNEVWFINFYSTFCSHCHNLAPTWRKFAREMVGAMLIGAVNCAEDPMLCQSQNVMSYPSLVMYPGGHFYTGSRDFDSLLRFAISKLTAQVIELKESNFESLSLHEDKYAKKGWIVNFCEDDNSCLSKINRLKLASMMDKILNVATVNCRENNRDQLCSILQRTNGVIYYPSGKISKEEEIVVESLDPKEIASAVLKYLPDLDEMEPDDVVEMVNDVDLNSTLLLRFDKSVSSNTDNSHLELKKLPSKVDVKVYDADCSKMEEVCNELNLGELPRWVMFKEGGGYEINYSKKVTLLNLIAFIRESRSSPLVTLTPAEIREIPNREGETWLIDYFAPWCPPCMQMLPEIRKLHLFVGEINIGTIDCQAHRLFCEERGITSYPTTVLYHNGVTHKSVGFKSVTELAEFIEEARNPSVNELSSEAFETLVRGRSEGQLWVVDFHALWCGPCVQLTPEYRKLARILKKERSDISFGAVNCDDYIRLCKDLGIYSYPTIRLYPGKLSSGHTDYPSNWWRDYQSMSHWIREFLPTKVCRLDNDFIVRVLDDTHPWLVNFFSPWCGHCVRFAPIFEEIAEILDGKVKLGKVNCDQWPNVCRQAGVQSYPNIRLFTGAAGNRQAHDGIMIRSQSRDTIVDLVEQHLANSRSSGKDEL